VVFDTLRCSISAETHVTFRPELASSTTETILQPWHSPGLQDIATPIAERNGKLACMLADFKVQHGRGSPVEKWGDSVPTK